eukprot:TRINITY_DN1008_c0_g7_i1.p1 TRINITY_DN1008_c0_g7~~TRINITY_DN1008_c0_g7_i1.p1  ORF type:complete len:267 (+),score=36.37 TRINITY_DN1008_c0_g7_i1:183-983(+)
MGWTWSFAVQGQFYVLFPFLIKWFGMGRKFLAVVFLILLASLTRRIQIFFAFMGQSLPPNVMSREDADIFTPVFVHFYSATSTRIGTIFVGVLLAYICTFTKYHESLRQNPLLSNVLLLLSSVVLWANTHYLTQGAFGGNFFWTVFLSVGGIFYNLAISYFLYISMYSISPVGKWLNRFLSHRCFYALAKISYPIYLMHSALIMYLYAHVFYPMQVDIFSFIVYAAVSWVVIVVVGWLIYAVVERPANYFFLGEVDGGAKPPIKSE